MGSKRVDIGTKLVGFPGLAWPVYWTRGRATASATYQKRYVLRLLYE
jgi:hypothetical protein